jgi:hypothetical protein
VGESDLVWDDRDKAVQTDHYFRYVPYKSNRAKILPEIRSKSVIKSYQAVPRYLDYAVKKR